MRAALLFLLSLSSETTANIFSESSISWGFEPDSNIIFHAYVIEKNNEIVTYPPLRVHLGRGTKLCQLHLLPSASHQVPSFVAAQVIDAIRGTGELQLNETDLYQTRLQDGKSIEHGVYHLKVLAEDCSSPPQLTIPWALNVVIVPTELPVWSTHHYSFSVQANLPVGEIVGKVTAYAAFDFSPGPDILATRLGDDTGMCSYTIDQPLNSPFDIDGHGVIRSRRVLTSINQQEVRFDLNVSGFDCHLPVARSSTVRVSIFVRPECAPHWEGLNQEIVYPALSIPQIVAPTAHLRTCDSKAAEQCKLEHAMLRMKILWTTKDARHMSDDSTAATFCDLDTLSLRAQRHLCGISLEKAVELLPYEQSTLLATGRLNSQPQMSEFNGSRAWPVPESTLPRSRHRLDNAPFTLSFWMNHSGSSEPHAREHVLCITDNREKNRHHFAVYVRNCKLFVLLRREPINPSEQELFQMYPSQWRFDVDEVCDATAWHHYTLLHRPPPDSVVKGRGVGNTTGWRVEDELQLYVDGDLIATDPELIHIKEIQPMQKIHHHVLPTNVTVGACWHSGEARYTQYFVGQLAGLTLTHGIVESEARLQCLVNCKPRLHVIGQLVGRNSEHPGLPALHRSQVDNLVFETPSLDELGRMLRTVVYFNPRIRREPKQRPEPIGIFLTTDVRYKNDCLAFQVPEKTVSIVRLPINERIISLLSTARGDDHLLLSSANPLDYSDIFSSLPAESLLLTKIGSLPVEVSEAALHQGVWLFPSLDVSWKRTGSMAASGDLEHRGTASYCDVSLCDSTRNPVQPNTLVPNETLAISDEYISDQVRVNLTPNGLRLDGPAPVEHFNQALQHVRWIHAGKSIGLRTRCFQVLCTAEFETVEHLVATGPLKVESNKLQAVYRIRPTNTPFNSHESLARNQSTSALTSPHDSSKNFFLKEGIIELLWNNKGTYLIAILASTILLLLLFTMIVAIVRSRRTPSRPSLAHQQRATWRRAKQQTGQSIPNDSSVMQLITNPASNPEETAELEEKFCYYDRQVYGGDPDETEQQEDFPHA